MNSDTSLTDEEALAIAKAATPREWTVEHYAAESTVLGGLTTDDGPPGYPIVSKHSPEKNHRARENATFIATFNPAYVTSLIERARTAEAASKGVLAALTAQKVDLPGAFSPITLADLLDARDPSILNGLRALSPTRTDGDQTLSDNLKKEA